MIKLPGRKLMILAYLLSVLPLSAQVLNNQSLSGKYYFRHLSLGTDGVNPGNFTDPRTLLGTITFDGSGHYAYVGPAINRN